MIDVLSAETNRRLRAVVLRTVYQNQEKQLGRLDGVTLCGVLSRIGWNDLSLNHLFTILQDLQERKCLWFKQEKNAYTGHISITGIQITPRGRDLVEGTAEDEAVAFVR